MASPGAPCNPCFSALQVSQMLCAEAEKRLLPDSLPGAAALHNSRSHQPQGRKEDAAPGAGRRGNPALHTTTIGPPLSILFAERRRCTAAHWPDGIHALAAACTPGPHSGRRHCTLSPPWVPPGDTPPARLPNHRITFPHQGCWGSCVLLSCVGEQAARAATRHFVLKAASSQLLWDALNKFPFIRHSLPLPCLSPHYSHISSGIMDLKAPSTFRILVSRAQPGAVLRNL
jgi:hypothetical protein